MYGFTRVTCEQMSDIVSTQCMALQELPVNRQGILSASEESFSYCTWSGFRMKTGFEIT